LGADLIIVTASVSNNGLRDTGRISTKVRESRGVVDDEIGDQLEVRCA
jgi:hypothetical protein